MLHGRAGKPDVTLGTNHICTSSSQAGFICESSRERESRKCTLLQWATPQTGPVPRKQTPTLMYAITPTYRYKL